MNRPDQRPHRSPYMDTIDSRGLTAMTRELIERSRKRHEFADVGLLVTAATLVVSLVIAFTAVSIGIARADTLMPLGGSGNARLALSIPLGLLIAGLGGLTACLVRRDTYTTWRD